MSKFEREERQAIISKLKKYGFHNQGTEAGVLVFKRINRDDMVERVTVDCNGRARRYLATEPNNHEKATLRKHGTPLR